MRLLQPFIYYIVLTNELDILSGSVQIMSCDRFKIIKKIPNPSKEDTQNVD